MGFKAACLTAGGLSYDAHLGHSLDPDFFWPSRSNMGRWSNVRSKLGPNTGVSLGTALVGPPCEENSQLKMLLEFIANNELMCATGERS